MGRSTKTELSHQQDLGENRGPPDSGIDRHTPGGSYVSAQSLPRVMLPPSCPPLSVGISPDSGIEFDRWGVSQETPQ